MDNKLKAALRKAIQENAENPAKISETAQKKDPNQRIERDGNDIYIDGNVHGDIIINRGGKKRSTRTAGILCALLIIALTVSIHTDSIKKDPNLSKYGSELTATNQPPEPIAEFSTIPVSFPEITEPTAVSTPAIIKIGPGCSRQVIKAQPVVPDYSRTYEKTPL